MRGIFTHNVLNTPRACFLSFVVRLPSQELLRSSLYSGEVEASLPRVVARAASVLEAVKERGRKVGDVMDAATEEVLKPQVRLLCESPHG